MVLPGSLVGEEGILVYLLAATKQPGRAVFGKHHRVLVSADGRTVKRFEPLSKTAMEPGEQGELVALFVSHILSDSPIETHVFTSMLERLPVVVDTSSAQLYACRSGRRRPHLATPSTLLVELVEHGGVCPHRPRQAKPAPRHRMTACQPLPSSLRACSQ